MTGRADQSFSHVADGVSEVRHAARKQLHRGVDVITVFATSGVTYELGGLENVDYSGEELRAIVEIATDRAPTWGPCPLPVGIQRAVSAWVHSIERGTHMTDESIDRRRETGAYLVSTLSVINELSDAASLPAEQGERVADALDHHTRMLGAAMGAGVPTAMSSDFAAATYFTGKYERTRGPGRGWTRFSRRQRSPTTNSAEPLGVRDRLGRLEPGYTAEPIAVDGSNGRYLGLDPARERLTRDENGQIVTFRQADFSQRP